MTSKGTSKVGKKKAGKSASGRAASARKGVSKKATKASAPARKKSRAGGKTARKKTTTKAKKPRTARPAASRKGRVKSARGRTSEAKHKTPAKKARRRPPLNVRTFRRKLLRLQGELVQAYMNAKGDSRSRESDGTEDYIDYAVSSYDREFLLSLTELEQHRLALVDEALKRIERGGYGLCTQCERPIPTKRLEVQPWARYCLRCQELADSGLVEESLGFPPDDEDEGEPVDELDDLDVEDDDDDEIPDESRLIGG